MSGEGWEFTTDLDIGRVLLDSGASLVPAEIGALVGRDASYIKKRAEDMAQRELLVRDRPTGAQLARPGRTPEWAFRLAAGQEGALREALAAAPKTSDADRSQQLVFVAADALADLFHILAVADYTAGARWFAVATGQRREYAFSFEPEDEAAATLVAVLGAVGVEARIVSLEQAKPVAELVEQAREAARRSDLERLRQRTRKAS
jgi:hypothetical protein